MNDTPSDPPDATEEVARAWVVRLASGEADEHELQALRAWRATSSAHECAFVTARTAWQQTGRYEAAFRRGQASADKARVHPARARQTGGLVAAGIALALLLPVIASQNWPAWFTDHATGRGGVARVELPDGTVALLDTDSAIDYSDGGGIRRVDLRSGAAWFEVAHDAEHPFEVHAGEGVATAVGTAFGVRRNGEDAVVSVTEGRVRVEQDGRNAILMAGSEGGWEEGGVVAAHAFDEGRRLAWRQRRLVIEGMPLGQALDELERYRPGYIVLLDDTAAARPVSGVFATERTDAAIDILAGTQGLSVTRLTPWLTIIS